MMGYKLLELLKSSFCNQKGQGLVEYILIMTFIALVVIIGLIPVGPAIGAKFTEVVTILRGS